MTTVLYNMSQKFKTVNLGKKSVRA